MSKGSFTNWLAVRCTRSLDSSTRFATALAAIASALGRLSTMWQQSVQKVTTYAFELLRWLVCSWVQVVGSKLVLSSRFSFLTKPHSMHFITLM